ncbi:GIN domain-containing protein [Sphingomonas colocasiae]|uniref:DUF2807 domain-containing protein n=1 Tax=Sphingomonas colocasiae TaxID=1848973 RepID=A0ABS7PVY9_9SPHN|nr:DUF2807 domain-containing protein [Sphingomonas colocasiae]MBY8825448.1 DUF2807 domain-containing protein [Sphingomonas colocasiae]
MNIRQFAVAFMLLAPATPLTAAERVETVTSFDRIHIDGPYRVEVITGRGASARLSGSREALDRITVNVQGTSLTIRTNRTGWTGGWPGEDKAGPVTIRVTTGELRAASVSGSGSISIDRIRGARVQLGVEGSGQLKIGRTEADRLDMTLLGSGAIAIAGAVKSASAIVRGSASIDGAALVANDLNVSSESAGTVALGARNSATVKATGSGEVRIAGAPACTVTALGSGQVYCGAAKK